MQVKDVDLQTGKITILKSKGNKDRNVMMSHDVLNLCRIYHNKVNSIFPKRTHFFPNNICNQYSKSFLDLTFHEIWDKTGISVVSGNSPRVHDFRHGFSVRRLNLWVEEGKDIQAYLP